MKVFLSSTAVDLVAHRQVADDTILRLSQQAVVMERFGPLPGEPVAECERKAREADVLICLVAHRYGFEPEPGRGSITRREVEAARAAGKDVLVWIVADDHPWSEKKEQDRLTDPTVLADPAKVAAVAGSVQALQEFKRWLRASFVYDSFTTPDDLGKKIAVALGTYGREPAAGGVPAAAPARGEVRIVHALQPAPHFHGREALLEELSEWAADLASPDRVWALVAPGGSGKTAVAERLVDSMEPGAANVLVWSFYERPDADVFLRECNQLFLGEEEGPAGGQLERLQRGLRDGRPNLIVLDGLERVQEEARSSSLRVSSPTTPSSCCCGPWQAGWAGPGRWSPPDSRWWIWRIGAAAATATPASTTSPPRPPWRCCAAGGWWARRRTWPRRRPRWAITPFRWR